MEDFPRAFMHARDILRTVGITGFDATANIATLLTLRELETQYPSLMIPNEFTLERSSRRTTKASCGRIADS
jgi:hypothetical protein